jgi:hypothetical protein
LDAALSDDVLLSIFALLSARDLLSASLVCKAWRSVAVSDALWRKLLVSECSPYWPLVLFSETSLRGGPSFPG